MHLKIISLNISKILSENPDDGEKIDLPPIEIPDVQILNANDADTILKALES
jgi:hypothetical protein